MHPYKHAAATPDKPAYIMAGSGEVVTYRDLDRRANQGARLLRSLGLGRGDAIAVMMDNSPRYFEVIWAAERIGVYTTCISSKLTAAEAEYIVRDGDCRVLIVSKGTEQCAAALLPLVGDLARLMVDGAAPGYDSWEAARDAQPDGAIDEPAPGQIMLYSSGTTGKPKGVRFPLPVEPYGENVSPIVHLGMALFGFNPDMVYLSPAPLYHAAPLRWSMAVQQLGGTVVVMERFDPERALEFIARYQITHAQWVPTHFIRMLKLPEDVRGRYDHSSLKAVWHAAAPCPIPVKQAMIDWWGPIVGEYYAGTEGQGIHVISSAEWLTHQGSVGRNLTSLTHICDEEGNELPPRSEGAIFFESLKTEANPTGAAPFTYHNDPAKTRESTSPQGWTTLGDVGWMDEEGYLHLTDRKSFMIISGGVNIYPAEIENLLVTHPEVADVAVIGAPHEEMGEEVVAVVQPRDPFADREALAAELSQFARAYLSHVKAPRRIDFRDELPRHETGKLYKRLLRDEYWGKAPPRRGMSWNFGDLIEAVEAAVPPDRVALAHGDQVVDWAGLKRRSNNLARALVARGLRPGERMAFYARNSADYLIALMACWKARATHVNVNYRYVADELAYILNDSDATVLIHGFDLRAPVAAMVDRAPLVRAWVEIGEEDPPGFAERFDDLADGGDGEPLGIERSPEDRFFIYTGGTTGMPKGVVWTHADLNRIALLAAEQAGLPVPSSIAEFAAFAAANPEYPRTVCGPPIMHGTGLLSSYGALLGGGMVATLTSAHFSAAELLDLVDRWRANRAIVVGDAFARPILEALDAAPERWDVSSVRLISSSGVMWTQGVKEGLIRHMPLAVCQDNFSSSEAIGMGTAITSAAGTVETAKFVVGARCRVLDDADRDVVPGSGVTGKVVLAAPAPIEYHKDPEKSARTFRTIGGQRFVISGDFARVEADGTITLLGRGSACINSAGEKVFPEEVEEALKLCPGVADALVFGAPDPTWGQAVTAVVRTGTDYDEGCVRDLLRARLAGYKQPKRIHATGESLRAPNGKADYAAAKRIAEASSSASIRA